MASPIVEQLEDRTLLAGVTVITHGYSDNTNGWLATMADAIVARAGGSSAVSLYTLQIGLNSQNQLAVLSFGPDPGSPILGTASSGETVVKLDWSSVSADRHSTVSVGDVAANYLLHAHGDQPALAEQPMHLIGHSRGTSLSTEIAKDLGKHGVWVEQVTSLDPRPSISWGDIPVTTWSNVLFADDYYQSSNVDINGLFVKGAFVQSLQASVAANWSGSPHQEVHAWYYGTIDQNGTSDGWPVQSSWYGHSAALPARDQAGFHFSSIAGGKRPRGGTSPALGGTASRVDPGKTGVQWPDVGDVDIIGMTSVHAGRSLQVHFAHEDRRGSSQAVIFLDPDRNPYNGNAMRVAGRYSFRKTTPPTLISRKAGTSGVAPGTYFVGVQISDAHGLTRYAYAPQAVTIS